nr:hypothetical protein BaRGS_000202 [Batillaria attramentaria]
MLCSEQQNELCGDSPPGGHTQGQMSVLCLSVIRYQSRHDKKRLAIPQKTEEMTVAVQLQRELQLRKSHVYEQNKLKVNVGVRNDEAIDAALDATDDTDMGPEEEGPGAELGGTGGADWEEGGGGGAI